MSNKSSSQPRYIRIIGFVLLCFCVIVNILGLPVTLLNPGETPDQASASFFEGFSVPPSPIQVTLSPHTEPVIEMYAFVSRPVLASTPFHPPISPLL